MNFVLCVFLSMAITLNLYSYSEAKSVPAGYEKISWNSSVESVRFQYPKGQVSNLAETIIYRQYKPANKILRRNFAFNKNQLYAVSVIFDEHYVTKYGIEKLLQDFVNVYGTGVMDSSRAPHMISHIWHGKNTKISFSYAPKRPDMTVIIFEYINETGGTAGN